MKKRSLKKDILKIRKFLRKRGRLPSYSEICQIFNFSSKNAAYKLVKKLVKKGFLEKDERGKIVPKKLVPPLPIYGLIQAGFPSPAEEELVDTLSFDEYLVENPASSFLLKVSGDSMIEAGIFPQDLVIVDRGREPKIGDIVLASVDGEWTLKFFEKEKGKVVLVSGNKKYPKIYPKEELIISGVVTAVVRKYH